MSEINETTEPARVALWLKGVAVCLVHEDYSNDGLRDAPHPELTLSLVKSSEQGGKAGFPAR